MKTITLLCSLLIGSTVMAQDIAIYDNFNAFETAVNANCTGTDLTFENFNGGPASVMGCATTIPDDENTCYPEGELEEGFLAYGGVEGVGMISVPAGSTFGNQIPVIAPNNSETSIIIELSGGVSAIAVDIYNLIPQTDEQTEIRFFDDNDMMIGSETISTPNDEETFFGAISNNSIARVEIEGISDSGNAIGNLYFGASDCNILSTPDNLISKITLSPNPASDIVNVSNASGLNIETVALYDALGKKVNVQLVNNQLNIANLAKGIYLMTIKTDRGVITKKVIKN